VEDWVERFYRSARAKSHTIPPSITSTVMPIGIQ